jgi:crotonobetainyl-CoA:carnitine CoA-transferase CaiB-like acyl-CoA transferase
MYRTKDGKLVVISVLSSREFEGLCRAMNAQHLLADERFASISARLRKENADELDRIVAEWVSTKNLEDVIEASREHGFSASPVRSSFEVYHDEHLRARGSVWFYDDPIFGDMVAAGNPIKLSRTPARIKWSVYPVGYHNRYVFKRLLGLSEDEIEELVKEGAISFWADFIGRKPPADFRPEEDAVFMW